MLFLNRCSYCSLWLERNIETWRYCFSNKKNGYGCFDMGKDKHGLFPISDINVHEWVCFPCFRLFSKCILNFISCWKRCWYKVEEQWKRFSYSPIGIPLPQPHRCFRYWFSTICKFASCIWYILEKRFLRLLNFILNSKLYCVLRRVIE